MKLINDYKKIPNGISKNAVWFTVTVFLSCVLLASLIYLFVACSEPQICWDCEIKTTFHRNPEHFTDTLVYQDTTERWCDINPKEFEKHNTDTILVFYIDSLGNIVGFWGTEVNITKCR